MLPSQEEKHVRHHRELVLYKDRVYSDYKEKSMSQRVTESSCVALADASLPKRASSCWSVDTMSMRAWAASSSVSEEDRRSRQADTMPSIFCVMGAGSPNVTVISLKSRGRNLARRRGSGSTSSKPG